MNKETLKSLIKANHANRYEFAKSVCISKSLIDKILSGHCDIKPMTAKLFNQHFQLLALEKATKELSTLSLGDLVAISDDDNIEFIGVFLWQTKSGKFTIAQEFVNRKISGLKTCKRVRLIDKESLNEALPEIKW